MEIYDLIVIGIEIIKINSAILWLHKLTMISIIANAVKSIDDNSCFLI